jgi:hypothetical protein
MSGESGLFRLDAVKASLRLARLLPLRGPAAKHSLTAFERPRSDASSAGVLTLLSYRRMSGESGLFRLDAVKASLRLARLLPLRGPACAVRNARPDPRGSTSPRQADIDLCQLCGINACAALEKAPSDTMYITWGNPIMQSEEVYHGISST